MTPDAVVDLLNSGGVIALLVMILFAVVVGLQRKWWVPGWVYEQTLKERDDWEKIAEGYGDKLERILDILDRQQATPRPRPRS